MSSPTPPHAKSTLSLLRKLYNGMEKRPSLMGGAAREGLDAHLLSILTEYTNRHQIKSFSLVGPPPRRVALAMALGILAQPHLSVTFTDLDPVGDHDVPLPNNGAPEAPLLIDPDCLCKALALSTWELDQLRDDIDRNVSHLLKQRRALRWLWARYAEPKEGADSLLSILFSGITNENSKLFGLGGQLYGLLDGECENGPNSLFTPIPRSQNEDSINPRNTFFGRFVDSTLIHALAKGIGADEDEAIDLLNSMICCIPQQDASLFVANDLWRIKGFDGLTHLSGGYASTQWLFHAIASETMQPLDSWLEWRDGTVDEDLAQNQFDRSIIPRLQVLLNQFMAQNLSTLLMEDVLSPLSEKTPWAKLTDLDLLQLHKGFDSVAQPLLKWPSSPMANKFLQDKLNVSDSEVRQIQAQLTEIWQDRYVALWSAPPQPKGHQTTLTRLLAHMSRTTLSHRKIWHRNPIYDLPHRNVLALFSGFYFSELPLERCWHEAGEAIGSDPVGQWFWPTWQRILNMMEDTSTSTFSGFD